MEFDNTETRLIFPDVNGTNLSYSIRCLGYQLSKFYTDLDLNIYGNIVEKKCGVIRVIYKEESYFRYLLLVAIGKKAVGNLLFINKIFYEKYIALQANDAASLCIFDLINDKIYYFKSSLKVDEEFFIRDGFVVFDTSLASSIVDIDSAELLALGMAKDDLVEDTYIDIDSAISGQLMSNWLPIGIVRKFLMFIFIALGTVELATFDAMAIVYFLIAMLFSPRVVGEVLYAFGRFVRLLCGK